MGTIAKDSGGGDYRRVPPGVYVGRCIGLIDLGTQEVEFNQEKKLQHKALIKWEVLGEDDAGVPLTAEVNGQQMPLTVSKRYTMSLSTKARLRADLAAWRGRDFTPEELKAFDVSKLLGAYAMLNVQQDESANGKTYTNVASITPLPREIAKHKPPGVHALEVFDIDNPDMGLFETFHDRLKETIEASVEWKARQQRKPAQPAAPSTATAFEDMESDVPFVSSCDSIDMQSRHQRRMQRRSTR